MASAAVGNPIQSLRLRLTSGLARQSDEVGVRGKHRASDLGRSGNRACAGKLRAVIRTKLGAGGLMPVAGTFARVPACFTAADWDVGVDVSEGRADQ